jgi:hypothetical protein
MVFPSNPIDGTAHYSTMGVSSASVGMATSKPGDLLILAVGTTSNSAYITVTTVSGGGLTWKKRGAATYPYRLAGVYFYNNLEVWYALQPTAGPVTISVTLSGTASVQLDLGVFGVVGASGFDPGRSSLSSGSGNTSLAEVTGFSTTQPNTFVFGICEVSIPPGAGSGFTLIISGVAPESEYQVFTSVQTGITVAFASFVGSTYWLMVADALVAAPPVWYATGDGLTQF